MAAGRGIERARRLAGRVGTPVQRSGGAPRAANDRDRLRTGWDRALSRTGDFGRAPACRPAHDVRLSGRRTARLGRRLWVRAGGMGLGFGSAVSGRRSRGRAAALERAFWCLRRRGRLWPAAGRRRAGSVRTAPHSASHAPKPMRISPAATDRPAIRSAPAARPPPESRPETAETRFPPCRRRSTVVVASRAAAGAAGGRLTRARRGRQAWLVQAAAARHGFPPWSAAQAFSSALTNSCRCGSAPSGFLASALRSTASMAAAQAWDSDGCGDTGSSATIL